MELERLVRVGVLDKLEAADTGRLISPASASHVDGRASTSTPRGSRESGGSHRQSGAASAGRRPSAELRRLNAAGATLEPWKNTGKGQRKREQARRPRWRVEGVDDSLVDLHHRQASISDLEVIPTVLSQDKLQRRIAALDNMHAFKAQTAGPSPEMRHR